MLKWAPFLLFGLPFPSPVSPWPGFGVRKIVSVPYCHVRACVIQSQCINIQKHVLYMQQDATGVWHICSGWAILWVRNLH